MKSSHGAFGSKMMLTLVSLVDKSPKTDGAKKKGKRLSNHIVLRTDFLHVALRLFQAGDTDYYLGKDISGLRNHAFGHKIAHLGQNLEKKVALECGHYDSFSAK